MNSMNSMNSIVFRESRETERVPEKTPSSQRCSLSRFLVGNKMKDEPFLGHWFYPTTPSMYCRTEAGRKVASLPVSEGLVEQLPSGVKVSRYENPATHLKRLRPIVVSTFFYFKIKP